MEGEIWTLLEMQQRLGHKRIDLLKVDIEGWEFPLFESWPELAYTKDSERILLPMQLLVEVSLYSTARRIILWMGTDCLCFPRPAVVSLSSWFRSIFIYY
jgi:hypothetical protein